MEFLPIAPIDVKSYENPSIEVYFLCKRPSKILRLRLYVSCLWLFCKSSWRIALKVKIRLIKKIIILLFKIYYNYLKSIIIILLFKLIIILY